ncbi:Serine/threonine protein kinase [Azospirillaceae bacterium]
MANPAPARTTRENEEPAADNKTIIDLGGRYEVLAHQPLPQFNSIAGPAFAARAIRERRNEPFAIVCLSGVMARMETITLFRSVENTAVMRMLDVGVINWPADQTRRLAFIFEKPAGRRLMNSMNEQTDPMPEEIIMRVVIEPVVAALRDLSSRGIVHGGVRPTNMFFRDLSIGSLMLGECLTTPCGFNQPILFETIERGMAQPTGKGVGSIADDLYALGITILTLLLGMDPSRGMDDDQTLQAKIDRGTYPALVGQMRLPVVITEPLRGLLIDDPKQRWTTNDLDLWLNGRRLSPKQPQVPKRSVRPYMFIGKEYVHCRTLARAFARDRNAATLSIESGEIDKWLRRSLSDDARADAVKSAIESASAAGKASSIGDRLVARVCMALDPPAPLRYKGKSTMIDGIGTILAEAVSHNDGVQSIGEIISAQLPMFWVNVQYDFKAEFVPLVHQFDVLRSHLEILSPGFGIERVLYELNPGIPCLSPIISFYFALNPQEVILALDVVARRPDRPREPIDRHIAAFLAARGRRFDEVFLAHITPGGDPQRKAIAMLSIFSETQRKHGPDSVPALAGWLITLLDPGISRFHNRPLQQKLRKEAESVAREGKLYQLARVVDDPEAMRQDKTGYNKAQREYKAADHEIKHLRGSTESSRKLLVNDGHQTAALVSSSISLVAMAITLFVFLMG